VEFLPITSDGMKVHAGFWKRFCAGFVDALILMPIAFGLAYLEGFSKTLAILITIPSTVLFAMYSVYFHAHFGGTLGKIGVKIRVTKPDGTRIGWLEAWKRSSVDLVFASVMLIVEIWALIHVDSLEYTSGGFWDRTQLLQSHYPAWIGILTFLQQVWIWSEAFVCLLNKRRRAIHDFIAGTVVIQKQFITEGLQVTPLRDGE
jgi:uncharacterized RDD family membrane protein YckC